MEKRRRRLVSVAGASALALCVGGTASGVVVTRDQDIDFVTVGHPGNAPWIGVAPSGNAWLSGRGSVGYSYRIARTEVTTAQWMEFVNTYTTRGGSYTLFANPTWWGAIIDTSYTGPGEKWKLGPHPRAADLPVGGITWREAAMFCNWLHNDKTPTIAAIETGAYDSSTWGWIQATNHYTDGERLPGARYWIPTLDEAMKATHYDPNRYGAGQGGWWSYNNRSEAPPVPGYPGVGETSANELSYAPLGTARGFALGSYEGYESAYGLLDTSGAGREWTEEWHDGPGWPAGLHSERYLVGAAISAPHTFLYDHVGQPGTSRPDSAASWGTLRIAAAVPCPTTGLVTMLMLWQRRRR